MLRTTLLAVVALSLSGCGVELLTTTAIQGELQGQQIKAISGQLDNAAGAAGKIQIERAIQAYRAEKGGNPPSLQALVPDYMPSVPSRPDGSAYGYDPAAGQLTGSAGAGASGGMGDTQKLQQIRTAINQYGQATGRYPGTLNDLVPQYLPALPASDSGQPFIYNNQNGYLAAPGQSAPQSASPQRGVGYSSPMGEMMTGMQMQQDVSRAAGGGSATSQASGYARGRVGQISGDYGDRQSQAVEELGF